jgi:hypothetical protein
MEGKLCSGNKENKKIPRQNQKEKKFCEYFIVLKAKTNTAYTPTLQPAVPTGSPAPVWTRW